MGIEIPGWLRWVGDLIGEPFPEGDETACRRQADRWRYYADQLESHKDGLAAATRTTLSGFTSGALHDTLDGLLKPYASSIDQTAGQLRQMADAVDNVATEIEFAKEMFIANLAALAATLVALAASAWINWGAPVEAAAAIAGIELIISQGIRAAAAKVASEALARVIAQLVTRALGGAAVNAGISAGLNAGIQGQQIAQGNRHEFDWESWQNDVKSGAISGAVMGPILKGAHDFDAGSALGNRVKNFGASFVGNAGGAAAAQQALTGHVNLADALGAGAVFGAVDGVRSPGIHGGGPEMTALTGDRPAAPLVEPLPATQHQQTPIESTPTPAGRSGDVSGARPPDVDVPLNLGSPSHDAIPLNPSGFTGADPSAPHHSAPPSTDAPTAGSPSGAQPAAGHAASAPTGPQTAPSTGPAGPSTGGPHAAGTRAGVSDVAAAPAARTFEAVAPAREIATPPSHEFTRESTPSRDGSALREMPAPRDTPPPRDAPAPHDTPPARDAQPPRDAQPRRDGALSRDGQAPRDAQSPKDATSHRGETAEERSRPAAQASRVGGEPPADTVRRAESAADRGSGATGPRENRPDPHSPHAAEATPSVFAAAVSPDAARPMPSDNLRAADPLGVQQEPTSEPSPRRPDADVARGGDDLPPPGPGPIDPTGFDNPANHRNYGPNELAPLEDPIHQAALEQALRGPDGDYRVGADPRTNAYGNLVNDGGPTVDGRANNCLDCALAGLASFYGDPTVSVPRFLDQRPDGTIDLISGEASGLDRARGWLGDDLHLSDQNLSVREQYAALHREITLSGPGSSALVVSEWHARDAAGNLLYHPDGTPVLDGSHATVVVYPHDGAGPVWWDPQNSLTSDHPPAMLVSESAYLWSTPIPADHFGPTPDQGGRHGAAGDRGTSTGLPGSDLPRPHLPGDPVRDGLGRFTDPGGGQHRGAADRAGEAGDRLGDRDRHHAPQPADQRGGPNLHDGKAFRAADGKPDLPAPMADHPAAHPGGSRDHRLPDDGGLPGTAARTHGGAQVDHQQADLHSRTEGRPVEGGDVSRPLAESAEPGSVARGSDGDALAGDTAASEPDAGDRGRTVASHLDEEHALALANEALWKRIPPVHPDEIRHHLADSTFGEQRARDNATWWRGLTGEEQRALIDSYAREIGNAEGVPAWARTEANEHRLSRLHDELQARREAGEHLSRREVKELRRYEQLRSTLDKARAELAGRGGEVHILAFDPHAFGGDGRIVVSVGHEPHHAESVSWHVPGITTTINSLDINLTNAMNHLESTRREDPHLTAASIAWIGYDAPSGLGLIRTPFRGLARAGGAILHGDIAAFNSAVDVIAGRRNDNHIFGHSYGSTTTSFAGRDGGLAGHVRSVTLLGSPGAAGQHRAADFNIGDRVFVASSSRDPVTAAGARAPVWRGRVRGIGLGIDPAMHSFGAQRITAEFPHHMDNWDTKGTHTAYYAFDTRLGVRTESLANFGRIAAGHFDEVQLDQHRTARRWWSAGKLTDEPVVGRPLRLEPTNGEPYSVKRRFCDPDWHSGHAENHVDSQQHLIAGDGVQPRGHDVHEGRCAHDVSDFLSERYGRDVDLRTGSTAAGVPARNLFEAWGSASKFANYNEIHDALIRHGDGSAALVTSQWAGGPEQGGHAYVAVNDGGAVYLVDRFELSGWPPSWGPDAVDRTAVGYFDRHGNPIEPLSGRPGQLAVADSIGHVAGAGPAPGDDGPAAVTPQRDYDASGHTIPTDRLVHPQAELLDLSLLDSAAANPHRVSDALAPGVPSTHPEVQHMVPDSYDPLAGIGEKAWNDRYWPTGNRDAHGNPELVWPDPGMHPQGFATPESRTPVVLNPGQFFDRFGPGFGVFGSPAGTSFPERALPPHSLDAGFHRYEVLRPVPVWEGPIAPAMGQPGGGVQYYFPRSIVDLVNAGYLREIPL